MKINDPVIYCPLAMRGHYNGKVTALREDGSVDIELDKNQTGAGELVQLRHIPVVPTIRDLMPGTCTRDP